MRALVERITDYLGKGGLFNPEMMEHLLLDCRAALASSEGPGTLPIEPVARAKWDAARVAAPTFEEPGRMDDELFEQTLQQIGEIALLGRLEFCAKCDAKQGYLFRADQVRSLLRILVRATAAAPPPTASFRTRTPGEDAWLDEIEAAWLEPTQTKRRNVYRTILRAYRANLLTNQAAGAEKLAGEQK